MKSCFFHHKTKQNKAKNINTHAKIKGNGGRPFSTIEWSAPDHPELMDFVANNNSAELVVPRTGLDALSSSTGEDVMLTFELTITNWFGNSDSTTVSVELVPDDIPLVNHTHCERWCSFASGGGPFLLPPPILQR